MCILRSYSQLLGFSVRSSFCYILLHRFTLNMDDVSYLPTVWYSGNTDVRKEGVLDEAGGSSTMVVFQLRTSLSANIADLMEIFGVWGMVGVHWTVRNSWFMSSCCSGCSLGLPSFPVSPICILCLLSLMISLYLFEMIGSWPHVAMVVVLVCPHFPSLRHILCLSPWRCPHLPGFTMKCCIFYCYTDSRSICFQVEHGGLSWNIWELAIGERGQLELKDETRKHALGW